MKVFVPPYDRVDIYAFIVSISQFHILITKSLFFFNIQTALYAIVYNHNPVEKKIRRILAGMRIIFGIFNHNRDALWNASELEDYLKYKLGRKPEPNEIREVGTIKKRQDFTCFPLVSPYISLVFFSIFRLLFLYFTCPINLKS